MPTNLSEHSLDDLAEEFDYSKLSVHPNNTGRMVAYKQGNDIIEVYLKTGTIATTIDHPNGRNQLFRRNLRWDEIVAIFENPRTHTGKGYRRHSSGQKFNTINNISYASNRFRYEDTEDRFENTLSKILNNDTEIESVSAGYDGFFVLWDFTITTTYLTTLTKN